MTTGSANTDLELKWKIKFSNAFSVYINHYIFYNDIIIIHVAYINMF